MNFSRREVLGLLAVSAVAGCSESSGGSDPSGQEPDGGLPDGGSENGSETSLAGSCASNFGDTMQRYETDERPMIATFSYPMGGEITTEQSDDVDHVTGIGYGRGDLSPLHNLTVSERGPLGSTADATEAYAFNDRYESGTVTTYGGQQRPAAILRDESSVVYLTRVVESDDIYEFSAQTAVGEGEPCPETYESISRQVIESFEPVA